MDVQARLPVMERVSELPAETARARPELAVRSCPGRTGRDLVTHRAITYLHKAACPRLNARPGRWPTRPRAQLALVTD